MATAVASKDHGPAAEPAGAVQRAHRRRQVHVRAGAGYGCLCGSSAVCVWRCWVCCVWRCYVCVCVRARGCACACVCVCDVGSRPPLSPKPAPHRTSHGGLSCLNLVCCAAALPRHDSSKPLRPTPASSLPCLNLVCRAAALPQSHTRALPHPHTHALAFAAGLYSAIALVLIFFRCLLLVLTGAYVWYQCAAAHSVRDHGRGGPAVPRPPYGGLLACQDRRVSPRWYYLSPSPSRPSFSFPGFLLPLPGPSPSSQGSSLPPPLHAFWQRLSAPPFPPPTPLPAPSRLLRALLLRAPRLLAPARPCAPPRPPRHTAAHVRSTW